LEWIVEVAHCSAQQAPQTSSAALRTVAGEELDKPSTWTIGFFFGNTELSLELWNVIAGVSGFDDY